MSKLLWDQIGERFYETGVDRGVLYLPDVTGVYNTGFSWNGLVSISESPTGAEVSPQYADNIQYLNLVSTEWFSATVEAFTYPDEFAQCDGTAVPELGVSMGQQARQRFGLAYRTRLGNDQDGPDFGYKLHVIYGALAAPSEKAYTTINDSPEAITFSWEVSCEQVEVPGYKRTSTMVIDSTKVMPAKLASLETILYGKNATTTPDPVTAAVQPRLPLPAEIISLFAAA